MHSKPKKQKPVWEDDPREDKYIDDGALYALIMASRGLFNYAGNDWYSFTERKPIEWNHKDIIKFLIKVSVEYKIKLQNFSVQVYVFEDDYEKDLFDENRQILPKYSDEFEEYLKKNEDYEKCREEHKFDGGGFFECHSKFVIPPRHYDGAYKWAIDKSEEKTPTEEGKIFKKVFNKNEELTLNDLEKIFRMNSVIVPVYEPDEESEIFYMKRITNSILDHTSFDFCLTPDNAKQLQKDINKYIDKFISGQLKEGVSNRMVRGFTLLKNHNIYTFAKQKQMFNDFLLEMHNEYGNVFSFDDPFGKFPIPYDNDNDEDIRDVVKQRYSSQNFLFMHMVFAFEKLGYIKIKCLGNNWNLIEDKPIRNFVKIELLPTIYEEMGITNKFDKEAISKIPPVKLIVSDILRVQLKNYLLTLNKNTGLVCLNNFEGSLNPASQEFKILLKLITGKDYQATYQDILGENVSKPNKRNLSFRIRNLKKSLGILPIKKAKNKDCIKNIKEYGYRLTV